MFKYTIPKEILDEFKAIRVEAETREASLRKDFTSRIEAKDEIISRLEADFAAIEEKLDFVLGPKVETGEQRSIPVEPLAVQAGRKPWSQRKKERIQKSMSPVFIEKVMKGAATTAPEPVATEE